MRLHLDFQPAISAQKIEHQQGVLFIGSCFSEHIYQRLQHLYFNVNGNPFGIVFNPISITQSLQRIITQTYFKEEDVFEKNGLWFCFEAHSSCYAQSKQDLLQLLNTTITKWHQQLKTAKWLIITIGSAYAYKHSEQQKIVANCHKLPQQLFEKKMINASIIVSEFDTVIEQLMQFNSELRLILTVSPVKHLRDGVVENSLSKATLIQVVHQLVSKNTNCFYFPAYELVADDLRDYRFYETDMAHPNQQAIDYVWQKFSDVFFTESTSKLNQKLLEINLAKAHKPLQPDSLEYQRFKENYKKKCEELMLQFEWLKIVE